MDEWPFREVKLFSTARVCLTPRHEKIEHVQIVTHLGKHHNRIVFIATREGTAYAIPAFSPITLETRRQGQEEQNKEEKKKKKEPTKIFVAYSRAFTPDYRKTLLECMMAGRKPEPEEIEKLVKEIEASIRSKMGWRKFVFEKEEKEGWHPDNWMKPEKPSKKGIDVSHLW